MTNKERIMEKEVKFEVGKWYKNLSINSQKNTFGKFLDLRNNNKEFWMSEYIYNGKFQSAEGWLDYSSETVEIDIEEIQQYLPDDHPDKIKSNDFKVGDWVIAIGNINEYKNPTIGKLDEFSTERNYDSRVSFYGTDRYFSIWANVIRHATPEEINNHLVSIGQIPDLIKQESEKYPFKPLKPGDLEWEIQVPQIETHGIMWCEPAPMTKDNWKNKMILSIDDEELPMVSIIKTNTVKQLLNND